MNCKKGKVSYAIIDNSNRQGTFDMLGLFLQDKHRGINLIESQLKRGKEKGIKAQKGKI